MVREKIGIVKRSPRQVPAVWSRQKAWPVWMRSIDALDQAVGAQYLSCRASESMDVAVTIGAGFHSKGERSNA
jgi:hypothetical protein